MRTAPDCPPTPPPLAVTTRPPGRETGEFQRLDGIMLPGMIRKIFSTVRPLTVNLPRAGLQKNARHRFLAAAGAVKPCFIAQCWRFQYSMLLLKCLLKRKIPTLSHKLRARMAPC